MSVREFRVDVGLLAIVIAATEKAKLGCTLQDTVSDEALIKRCSGVATIYEKVREDGLADDAAYEAALKLARFLDTVPLNESEAC
ncbi:MAG: hypothetical protein KQJ78_11240 [Deltaproteobacteria bacterium]|nr:hypothetical protein [Deltaproteobacteria bacterium]